MNIFKFALVLLAATGLGFSAEEIISSDIDVGVYLNEENDYYDFAIGFCHSNDDYFLEHMLKDLTEEEQEIVQSKIDELLIKYDVSISDLNSDFEIRYYFMIDLMEFLYDSEIEYHYHDNHHNDNEEDDYGNHMGIHR
jgi:hypothetical protein